MKSMRFLPLPSNGAGISSRMSQVGHPKLGLDTGILPSDRSAQSSKNCRICPQGSDCQLGALALQTQPIPICEEGDLAEADCAADFLLAPCIDYGIKGEISIGIWRLSSH